MKAKLLGAVLLTGLLFGLPNRCRVCESINAAGTATIVATCAPVAAMARRIVGDGVKVVAVVPPGVDPRTWSPSPTELAEMTGARLILLNGAGLEKWATDAPLPADRVVDTSRRFAETLVVGADGKLAPYTWLDPRRAIAQAREMTSALAEAFPALGPRFEDGFTALERDLVAIDERLAAIDVRELTIEAPEEYTYLLSRYGWRRVATMSRRLHLSSKRERDGDKHVVFFDIAAMDDTDTSWLDRLRDNATRIEKATRRP